MRASRILVIWTFILGAYGCSQESFSPGSAALADSPLDSIVIGGEAAPGGLLSAPRVIEPLRDPRSHHTATTLPEGKILIAGGHDGSQFLHTAVIYDPATGLFRETAPMNEARAYHTAVRIHGLDGQGGTADDLVLIAGGFNGRALSSVEIFDVRDGRFYRMLAELPQSLHRHAAVRVPGPYDEYGKHVRYLPPMNQVLLIGGATETRAGEASATNSVFLYSVDPEHLNSSFCAIGTPPSFARVGHTATAFVGPYGVPGSMVLVYGGEGAGPEDDGYRILAEPEVYQVRTDSWTRLEAAEPNLPPRTNHRAVLLASGDILLVGGFGGEAWGGPFDLATIFRPRRAEITRSEFLSVPGPGTLRQSPEVVLLAGGEVVVSGGYDGHEREVLSSVEIFVPDELGGEFHPSERMATPRVHHSATYTAGRDGVFDTPDDEVLIVGGRRDLSTPLRTAETFSLRPTNPTN